jgi:hypothetical protein
MKAHNAHIAVIGTFGFILNLLLASPAWADAKNDEPFGGLSGAIFAVEAEVVASLDPGFPEGLVFDNCYFFNEDGSWYDPLFPYPNSDIVGIWVQHADLPHIEYTATVADASHAPVILIQNGTVVAGPGVGKQKILAYTTAVVAPAVVAVEVVSVGHRVETCPFTF